VPLPTIDPFLLVIIIFFGLLVAMMVGQQLVSARSPHVMYRPEQLTTTLDDVVGIDTVKEDVVRSLNLFLAHKTFRDEMGGSPRRGLLFEGAPGTGKTHLARAMAREAGVPFLFVSATSFQSMWYGATAKRIRSYFKALRKAARKEGGAIGFIEEIDAIAMARGGVANGMLALNASTTLSGCHGTGLPAVLVRGGRLRRDGADGASPARGPAASSTSCWCRCSPSTTRPAGSGCAAGSWTGSTCCCRRSASSSGRSSCPATSCSSPPPTGPTGSTRRCCAPAASTAA
jgi:hypothetical protein